MANTIQLKRRAAGNAGAPPSLKSGELAHNEVDNTLYIGKGDDGSGEASSIVPLAGQGAFVDKSTAQSIAGLKTFSVPPRSAQNASASTDLVRKSQFDAGLASKAASTHVHALSEISGLESALGEKSNTGHLHTIANVTGLDSALSSKASLASPSFSGTPTAPTASSGTSNTQLATTAFVQSAIIGFGAGDMARATYDSNNNGKVDAAEHADAVPWSGVSGKPASFPPSAHTHTISQVSGLQNALDEKAPRVSPAFSGTPTVPTASSGSNSTQVASTAFVQAALASLIDGAPGALNTLNELAAALGDDPNFASTLTNGLAGKLEKTANLGDLSNTATARANLGLNSLATQSASQVNITGGVIAGVTLDGGTF